MEVLSHLKRTESTSIASIRLQMKRPRPAPTKPKALKKNGRHVVWDPREDYTLLREGIPIKNELEAGELFAQDTIDESYFYLFKHNDPKVPRNQLTPVYEAAYYCSDTDYYIRVQKRYLKRAYAKMQRCDKSKMWDVLEDQTPYWVDRHAFCKQGQRASKIKYQKQKKGKSGGCFFVLNAEPQRKGGRRSG